MSMDATISTISTVEIAQKQRHLHLLQRVRENKSLSAKEINELKLYESAAKKTAAEKLPEKKHSKNKKRDSKGKFKAPAEDKQFAALAAELKSVASLDSQFEEHFELTKYPRIRQALEAAISQRVEEIIRERFVIAAQKDYRKVTLQQLVEITGKTRRTIYDWINKGLPRNADGSFYLPSFIGWFEKFTIEKLPSKVIAEINPLQAFKAARIEIDLKRARNELLSRDEVMAGQVARHQNLINSLSHKAEEIAMLANGQPQSKISEMLNSFFDELLSQQCQVPEQLQLPEEKAKEFEKLLNSLKSE